MTQDDDRRVLIAGSGLGLHAAAAAMLMAGYGANLLAVDVDRRRDDLWDRLDGLDMILDDRPRDSMEARREWPALRDPVRHIDTPKPTSKRKARRLRGKEC